MRSGGTLAATALPSPTLASAALDAAALDAAALATAAFARRHLQYHRLCRPATFAAVTTSTALAPTVRTCMSSEQTFMSTHRL